jgi:hypothetical protein
LKGLKLSKLLSKTRVVASIVGGSLISRQETPVCTYKGISGPTWDYPMRFYLDESVLQQSQLMIVFRVWRTPIFLGGNQLLGEVYFPVKLLLDNWTEDKQAKEGSCPVVTPSGKHRGCLVFKYDFGHGTIRGAPKKVGENLIDPAWSSQLLPSRHHGGCLSAPKSSPYNPAYYEATRLPQAPPFGTIY